MDNYTIEDIGADVFSEQEISDEKAKLKALEFFVDGVPTNVTLLKVVKESKISRNEKEYVLHTYTFQREDGKEKTLVDYSFAMTNALTPFKQGKDTLKIGDILTVTATDKGTDDRGYTIWSYKVEKGDRQQFEQDKAQVAKYDEKAPF